MFFYFIRVNFIGYVRLSMLVYMGFFKSILSVELGVVYVRVFGKFFIRFGNYVILFCIFFYDLVIIW